MIFKQLFDKTSSTYTYLISSGINREALIIDPVLEDVDVPVILMDKVIAGMPFHGIGTDHEYGAALAADHLIRQGLKSLGMVVAEPESGANIQARIRGFKHQVRLAGLGEPVIFSCHTEHGMFSCDQAYSLISGILQQGRLGVEGLLVDSTSTVLGLMKALREYDIHVPQDVALIVFGDAPELSYLHPTLSAVEVDLQSWGVEAVKIANAFRDGVLEDHPHQFRALAEVYCRESSNLIKSEQPTS